MRRFLALLMTLLLLPLASFAEETDPVPTQEPTPVPTPTLTPAPTPVPTPTLEELWDQYAEARFRGRKIVCGAVIIAKDGEILYSYSYGNKTRSSRDAVTLDTCFRIASVTKLVTAVGLMQLLEEQDISLETPVKDIVGFPVVNPAFPDQDITIRQVMSHTSSFIQTQYYHPNWDTLQVGNKYFSTTVAPGTAYAYSNLNGGLFGAMIEALSGQSVNTYMREHVFGPLGINAAYHMALLPDQSDLAPQLSKSGTIAEGVSVSLASISEYDDTCNPRANTHHTSGGLIISANGLIRIISMLQRGGELDGVRILSEEAVALMMQDQQTIPGSSVLCQSEYGLAMARVENMPGGTWYGHQGRMKGLSSNIYFQPDTGLSIAVIANGYEAQSVDGVVSIARVFMEKAQELLP